jgi:hypothetical protein
LRQAAPRICGLAGPVTLIETLPADGWAQSAAALAALPHPVRLLLAAARLAASHQTPL